MGTDPQPTLLQKWAPEVIFHPDEKYFPCPVDWYLTKTELLDGTGNVFSDQTGAYNPVINNTTRPNDSCSKKTQNDAWQQATARVGFTAPDSNNRSRSRRN